MDEQIANEQSMSASEKLFKENIRKLCHARQLEVKYCELDSTHYYFIINRHLGDSIWILRLLHSIKEYYKDGGNRDHSLDAKGLLGLFPKKKIIKKVSVITTKTIADVANLYKDDIDSIIILNKADLEDMEFYALSQCSPFQNFIYDEDVFMRVNVRNNRDEGTRNRNAMFGVNNLMWQLCIPKNLPRTKMKIPITAETNMASLLSSLNCQLNQIVVLCPFAYSSSTLENDTWIKIALLLQQNGFRVFTNVAGAEVAIYATEKLSVPIDVLACMAVNGCRIIGVQCGLMDILVQLAPSKLIVLNVIKNDRDRLYANGTRTINEVNVVDGVTRLRIEHFEEDYVLKLLMDNFH